MSSFKCMQKANVWMYIVHDNDLMYIINSICFNNAKLSIPCHFALRQDSS